MPIEHQLTMAGSRPVTDEPVRGIIQPAWLYSLSGAERMRVISRDLVPYPPTTRLFGFRIGHIGAGAMTLTMPASPNLLAIPALEVTPLNLLALYGAAFTTLGPGLDLYPITVSQQYFRLPRPQPGNLLARARTLNSSSVFVCSAVEVEDPIGRQVSHAVAQWAIRPVDPPPPAPPDPIVPVEEPTYATPDPPDRAPAGAAVPNELFARKSGREITRMLVGGELPPLPLQHLMGAAWVDASEDEVRMSFPASEWFCRSSRNVSEEALGALLDLLTCVTMLTQLESGQTAAVLDSSITFLRPLPADGRQLPARGRVDHKAGNLRFLQSTAYDADGSIVAIQTAAYSAIDQREHRAAEPERVLATLLFTDIVGSTERAQRIGDANWRSLLDEHDALVRRELAAHRGREINTTGDGFLARFESPAAALRCARSIRDGVRRLDLEVRAGVHTGECEVQGNDLTGIALHVAARIVAQAGANEIVVSQMVRDLAAGSGLRFEPRGSHTLKGIEGEWMLFAVESP